MSKATRIVIGTVGLSAAFGIVLLAFTVFA